MGEGRGRGEGGGGEARGRETVQNNVEVVARTRLRASDPRHGVEAVLVAGVSADVLNAAGERGDAGLDKPARPG